MSMMNVIVNTIKNPQIKCNNVITPKNSCPWCTIKVWKKRLKEFK